MCHPIEAAQVSEMGQPGCPCCLQRGDKPVCPGLGGYQGETQANPNRELVTLSEMICNTVYLAKEELKNGWEINVFGLYVAFHRCFIIYFKTGWLMGKRQDREASREIFPPKTVSLRGWYGPSFLALGSAPGSPQLPLALTVP